MTLPASNQTASSVDVANRLFAAFKAADVHRLGEDHLAPIDTAFFEGMIDPARLSFLDRLAVRLVKSPAGDRRDWPRIGGWADALAPRLMA